MSQFPFATDILFMGKLYKADQLPNTYFPTMVGIQLTEPALLLLGVGIVLSILLIRKRETAGPFLLFLAWFLIPALVIVGTRSPLYDNARQLYFLFPPLFILMGLAHRKDIHFSYPPLGKGSAFPGSCPAGYFGCGPASPLRICILQCFRRRDGRCFPEVRNGLLGDLFKEITEYINSTAPENSRVLVYGPEQTVELYARPDIHVFIPQQQPTAAYDYVAFLTRENLDERRCKAAQDHFFGRPKRRAIFCTKKHPGRCGMQVISK